MAMSEREMKLVKAIMRMEDNNADIYTAIQLLQSNQERIIEHVKELVRDDLPAPSESKFEFNIYSPEFEKNIKKAEANAFHCQTGVEVINTPFGEIHAFSVNVNEADFMDQFESYEHFLSFLAQQIEGRDDNDFPGGFAFVQ